MVLRKGISLHTTVGALLVALVLVVAAAAPQAFAQPAYEDNPHPQVVFTTEEKTPITVKVDTSSYVYTGRAVTPHLSAYDKDDNRLYSWRVEADIPTFTNVTKGPENIVVKNAKLYDWEGTDVTDQCEITYVEGTIEITPHFVYVATAGASKTYDGTPLTGPKPYLVAFGPAGEDWNFDDEVNDWNQKDSRMIIHDMDPLVGETDTSLVDEETDALSAALQTLKVNGSRTAIGESLNTYEMDWSSLQRDNYKVIEKLGILSITSAAAAASSSSSAAPAAQAPATTPAASAATATPASATTPAALAATPPATPAATPTAATPTATPVATSATVSPAVYTPVVAAAQATTLPVAQAASQSAAAADDATIEEAKDETTAQQTEAPDASKATGINNPSLAEEPVIMELEEDETPLALVDDYNKSSTWLVPALFLSVLGLMAWYFFFVTRRRNAADEAKESTTATA